MNLKTNKVKVGLAATAALLLASCASDGNNSMAKGKMMDKVGQCHGVNSCKGKTTCATTSNACQGKNSCKGKGWVKSSKSDCNSKGGKFMSISMK